MPESIRAFWQAWLKWSEQSGINYFVGRKIPAWLDSLGMEGVAGDGDTTHFNGGSDGATYWTSTIERAGAVAPGIGQYDDKNARGFPFPL